MIDSPRHPYPRLKRSAMKFSRLRLSEIIGKAGFRCQRREELAQGTVHHEVAGSHSHQIAASWTFTEQPRPFIIYKQDRPYEYGVKQKLCSVKEERLLFKFGSMPSSHSVMRLQWHEARGAHLALHHSPPRLHAATKLSSHSQRLLLQTSPLLWANQGECLCQGKA